MYAYEYIVYDICMYIHTYMLTQRYEAHLKEVTAQCKELCTSFSVLVIRGTLTEDDNVEENRYVHV